MSRNPVIVVADDDKSIREIIAAALSTELGAYVLVAPDGRRLLDLVRRVRPVAVVVDVLMPQVDGPEAIRLLRADRSTAAIRIVAVSAARTEREALAAGADAFLAKPFEIERLIDLVGAAVA